VSPYAIVDVAGATLSEYGYGGVLYVHCAYTVISAVTGVDAVKAVPDPLPEVFQPLKV
jgi:hypothetical protein